MLFVCLLSLSSSLLPVLFVSVSLSSHASLLPLALRLLFLSPRLFSVSSCLLYHSSPRQQPLEPKLLDARPVDAKRGRSGRGSLAERKPLTGRDGETKKPKEKRKKKKF